MSKEKQVVRLAVPYNDIVAFRDRMMTGGEFYADGEFLLYSKKKTGVGLTVELRVDVKNRHFYPTVRVAHNDEITEQVLPVSCDRPLYGAYDFGDVVVNLVSFDIVNELVA